MNRKLLETFQLVEMTNHRMMLRNERKGDDKGKIKKKKKIVRYTKSPGNGMISYVELRTLN